MPRMFQTTITIIAATNGAGKGVRLRKAVIPLSLLVKLLGGSTHPECASSDSPFLSRFWGRWACLQYPCLLLSCEFVCLTHPAFARSVGLCFSAMLFLFVGLTFYSRMARRFNLRLTRARGSGSRVAPVEAAGADRTRGSACVGATATVPVAVGTASGLPFSTLDARSVSATDNSSEMSDTSSNEKSIHSEQEEEEDKSEEDKSLVRPLRDNATLLAEKEPPISSEQFLLQRRTRSIVVLGYAMYYSLTLAALSALYCVKDPEGM